MAELRFKVKADYEELGKLRAEIQKLKAELKSTGANTDKDTVKALESQLAMLTRQYEAMTKRIAEAEAQYDALAKKMTEKAKGIAKAQETISEAAVNPPATPAEAPATDTSLETQAKAYEELKKEIDAIAGSKTNLIKQMLDEQNAIRLINAELKQINAEQKTNGKQTQAQKERMTQLNDSLLTHKQALSEVRQSLSNYVKLENAASGSMNELSQSLGRMRMVYRDLSEEERNSPFGNELLASIQQADAKIKELDATIGNHQRNVGNYGQAWNGLGNSIQQLARELPALANGPRVFFSAISNNLPILADEIKRARTEYDEMVKKGEKGVPVWKQIGASIFSWQTALTVGITLLTMHGDKIIEWGQRLIQGSKGVTSTEKAVKKLNKAIAEGAKEAAKEVVELKVLERVATDISRSDDERNKAAKRVLETLDKQVTSTNILKVKNGEYATSINEVTTALIKQAQAQAAVEKIQEQYKKVIEAQDALSKAESTGRIGVLENFGKAFRYGLSVEEGGGYTYEDVVNDAIEDYKKKAELAQNDFNVWLEAFVGKFSFDDMFGKTSNADVHNYLADSLAEIEQITKMQADYAKEKARAAKDMEYSVEQARIDAMKDGYIKTRAQRALNNKRELEDLERQKQDYIERVVEQEKAIFEAQEEQRAKNDENYKKQTFNRAEAEANVDTTAYDILAEQARQRQAAAEDAYVEGLYKQYQSYTDKKKELEKAYLDDILALNTEYTLTGDEKYKRSIEERRKAYVKSMNALEKEFSTDEYKLIFGDPERMTSATIDKALEAARNKIAQLDKEADPETFQALSEAIAGLEDARDNNPFQGWGTSVMSIIQALYKIRNIREDIAELERLGDERGAEEARTKLEKAKKDLNRAIAGTGIAAFGNTLTKAAATMKEVAAASGDIHLEEQAEALEKAGGFISSVASGAASGGWIGAIIGGATSLMDMLVSSITESKAVAAEAKKAYDDYLDDISSKARSIDDSDYETIFGVRALERVVGASEAAKKAYEDYQKYVNEPTNQGHWSNGKDWVDEDDLQSMIVFEGKKQNYKNALASQTLGEKFEGLFDENGNLNLEKARSILEAYSEYSSENWYEALSDATQALEDYEENIQKVDNYLGSLFSNMGDEIVDAIMRGDDALEALQSSVGNVFANIAKQLITELMISDDFIEKYKKKWHEAIATQDNMADEAAVAEEMAAELEKNIADAQKVWEEIQKIAEEKGIDMNLNGEDEQKASSKGYQTLSEDTGNELVGRALAQYESNLRMEATMAETRDVVKDLMEIKPVVGEIRDIAAESRTLIADSYLELQQIRENTGAVIKPITEMGKKIAEWDTYIKRL